MDEKGHWNGDEKMKMQGVNMARSQMSKITIDVYKTASGLVMTVKCQNRLLSLRNGFMFLLNNLTVLQIY